MTVPTTTSRADYTGNGATTAWTVPFYFLDPTHIQVIRTQISTGVATTLALTTDYTVTGAGVQAGGTVTTVAALTPDQRLSVLRNVPLTQLSHYVPNDPFPSATHEQIVDQLTMEVQQLSETQGRALTLPANTASGVSTTLPFPVSNSLIGWNGAGTALANFPLQAGTSLVNLAAASGSALIGHQPASGSPTTVQSELLALDVAQKGRSAPHANFAWFTSDFTVVECQGPGRALLAQDIADVFQTKFGASIGGAVSYVHPQGSDANSGGSWRTAFLTLAQALRSTTCGVIYLWPGAYDLSDFRYTDSYGDHPKKIVAPYAGVTLRVAGDDPAAATWQLSGDYGGLYAMNVVTTNKPIRVLRKDLLDKYGEYTPMPQYSSVAELATVNFGWAYESAATFALTVSTTNTSPVLACANSKSAAIGASISGTGIPGGATIVSIVTGVSITISANATATNTGVTATTTGRALYVRSAMSENVNTTTKASIQVVYGDSSGDARTLLYSTTSYWENITFYGYISVLQVNGQATPQFWSKRCTFKYGNTHAILVQGGYSYTQDCRAHRQAADGANYNQQGGIVSQGVEINYTTQYAGDVDTWGIAQTYNPQGTGANKNGSSNHDSYVVRVNGYHADCFGPNVADTATSYSWNLGVAAGYNQITVNSIPSNPRYGILNQGNNAWNDNCAVTGNDAGFNSDSSAISYMFNCFGTTYATNSGTFSNYLPA